MELNLKEIPISVISGILLIIIYCLSAFIGISHYPPPYSPFDNWLSDLGNFGKNPNGALIYNIGVVITGILLFPFFIGLNKWYMDKKWHKVLMIFAQIVGCSAAFALMMVGVFYQDLFAEHYFWSTNFFLLNLFVLLLLSISLLFHDKFFKLIGIYGIGAAIFALSLVTLEIYILEWFTVFSALGFVGLLSFNMYKKIE